MIILAVLLPLLSLAVCIAVHVFVARSGRVSRPKSVVIGALVGLAVMVASTITLDAPARESSRYVLPWSLTYTFLVHCYFIGFYALGESARRLRLLIELRAAGQQGLTQEEILAVYNGRMIIDLRLRRLMSVRQVIERHGKYTLGRRHMLYVAQIVAWWGRLTLGAERRGIHA